MVITIEQALHPLLLTFSILGFGVYFPKKAYLNIFYDVTIWIVYVCLLYYAAIEFKAEKLFFETSTIINVLISIFVIITSVIMNIYYKKRFRIFIKRLAAVDNTLEKLGIEKIYHKLHTYVKRVLIAWLVIINLVNINDMKWWWDLRKEYRILIFPCIGNCHIHVNIFMELLLVTFLWYIGTRFDKINEYTRCLLVKEEYGLRYTWRKTVLPIHRNIMHTSCHKRVLYMSMHLHLELCQISRELNKIFGIQMTLEMINCIICVMRHCWFLYIHVRTKTFLIITPFSWLDIQMWMLLNGSRIFCLNYACQSVSAKANEMEKIIHQLTDFLRYADIRDEIYQFTLQMIHRPLKFTGLGFFYFGNGLLRRLIISVITFVIIVIQMTTIHTEGVYKYFTREKNITIISR